MRIQLNPIVKKDLRVTARSIKLSLGVLAYEFILLCAFLLALLVIESETRSIYSNNVYSYLVYLFPIISGIQLGIVALIMPIITATSISGEKERQTFDIMMTTCMSPMSIVVGKVISAVIKILFFVLASTPIMALAFVAGGIRWIDIFGYVFVVTAFAVFSGSIGIFCSSVCNRAITSVVMSFVFYFAIYGVGFVPMIIHLIVGNGKAGESMLFLLGNPLVFFEEYYAKMMTGETLISSMNISRRDVGFITYAIVSHNLWTIVSGIVILIMSFLFLKAAAYKVDPLHSSGTRKTKKKKEA